MPEKTELTTSEHLDAVRADLDSLQRHVVEPRLRVLDTKRYIAQAHHDLAAMNKDLAE